MPIAFPESSSNNGDGDGEDIVPESDDEGTEYLPEFLVEYEEGVQDEEGILSKSAEFDEDSHTISFPQVEGIMKRNPQDRKVASLWVPFGSIELGENVPLVVKFDWDTSLKGKVNLVQKEINSRILNGPATFADRTGKVQTVVKPVSEDAVLAVVDTIARELKNLVMAIPVRPSILRKMLQR